MGQTALLDMIHCPGLWYDLCFNITDFGSPLRLRDVPLMLPPFSNPTTLQSSKTEETSTKWS